MVVEYINTNKDVLSKVWKIDVPKNDLNDKGVVGILTTICSMWCGSEFKRGAQKKKRTKGARVDISQFTFTTEKRMLPFIENQRLNIIASRNPFIHMDGEIDEL